MFKADTCVYIPGQTSTHVNTMLF